MCAQKKIITPPALLRESRYSKFVAVTSSICVHLSICIQFQDTARLHAEAAGLHLPQLSQLLGDQLWKLYR